MPQRTLAASSRADRARPAERHPMSAHHRRQPVRGPAGSAEMTSRRAGTTAAVAPRNRPDDELRALVQRARRRASDLAEDEIAAIIAEGLRAARAHGRP